MQIKRVHIVDQDGDRVATVSVQISELNPKSFLIISDSIGFKNILETCEIFSVESLHLMEDIER
jgi:hypothetical protein